MSERSSFYRKIAYGLAIAVLLFPLSWLSTPATVADTGGRLAQMRTEYGLGQANLGEVDPASETMKLATLGLRGVAVNLLWEKANYYKKVEDWTNLTATLEQLAKLQPNFIIFWKFQAWNLSYNVSVEFDDYHDRYYYVRRGIEFLKKGEKYNVDNPQLLWDLGWFIGQKIGRADERVQYRRLFKADDDFHPPDLLPEDRDNWLVGKGYYQRGVDAVDKKGKSLGRKTPKVFYSGPAKSQINYAAAVEEEGFFDKARGAWTLASEEWRQFGTLVLKHTTGINLRLGDQPRLERLVAELEEQLEAIRPGVRELLVEERKQALTDEERRLLETPLFEPSRQQQEQLYKLQDKLTVTDRDVAERIVREQPEVSKQVSQLVNELERERQRLRFTTHYKADTNYDYWQTRCDYEQTDDALDAREKMYLARQAFRNDADLLTAKKLYDEGFLKWRAVLDAFPQLKNTSWTTGDDILEYVKQYREVLDQLDETLSDDFPLWDIIEDFDKERQFSNELEAYRQRHPDDVPAEQPAA